MTKLLGARRQTWRLPKYLPHAFQTKEQVSDDYERLAKHDRVMAEGYFKDADKREATHGRNALSTYWRSLARKHLLRSEKAAQRARQMRTMGSSRDRSKVTDLGAYRQKRAATQQRQVPSQSDYKQREVTSFQADMRRVEKLPLAERRENAREFAKALHTDPSWIAERVGWLLNGSYGQGAYIKAQEVARSPRMNQGAWLVQTAAALEWQVPPRMTAAAWHTLSAAQRRQLEQLIQREIRQALSE